MPGHYRIPSSSRYLSVESTTVECAKIHLMRVCVRKYQNSKARKWFRGRKHGPRRRRRQNCVCALAHSVHLATLFDRKQSEKGKKKLKRNEIRCNSRSRYDRNVKEKAVHGRLALIGNSGVHQRFYWWTFSLLKSSNSFSVARWWWVTFTALESNLDELFPMTKLFVRFIEWSIKISQTIDHFMLLYRNGTRCTR